MSRNSYETTYNQFYMWKEDRQIGIKLVRGYLTQLKQQQSKRVAHSKMCELAAILPQKHPETDWSWIKTHAREYSKEIGMAEIHRRPAPHEHLTVMAWKRGIDGRKNYGDGAIIDADGQIIAAANAVWVELTDPKLIEAVKAGA